MSIATRTSIHSDSSDDDLPIIPRFCRSIKKPPQKTFDDLFKETSVLIESQKRERNNPEQIAAINAENVKISTNANDLPLEVQSDSILDGKNDSDTFEEPSVRLLGEINHLQFITKKDLTLVKCGFNCNLDLSECEKQFIRLNENELQEQILCLETSLLKKVRQLSPFVKYVLKTMSIHPDVRYVRACKKFFKRLCKLNCSKDVSISYSDIFMVLFNYGVDTKKETFNILPGAKEIQKCEKIEEICQNWVFNLKAVLTSLSYLIKSVLFIKEDCLYNIFIYLLWISMDDFISINFQLKECTTIILHRFSKNHWPTFRLKIVQFVLSTNSLMNNCLNSIFKMLQIISGQAVRGVELHNYISYLALKKVTVDASDSFITPEYSRQLFSMRTLQPILESLHNVKQRMQLAAIKFIKQFIHSLKLISQSEQNDLRISLKRCEDSLSKHATIQQYKLCIIRSRLSTMPSFEIDEEMWDDEDSSTHSADEMDVDPSEPSLEPLNEESSNDTLQFEDGIVNNIKTSQDESRELPERFTKDLMVKENCFEISDDKSLSSQSLPAEPLVNEEPKRNSLSNKPGELLNDEVINHTKNIVNCAVLKPETNSDDYLEVSPERLSAEIKARSTREVRETNVDVEMENNSIKEDLLTPSKTFSPKRPSTKIKIRSTREVRETNVDVEMEINSVKEDLLTPSKTFNPERPSAKIKTRSSREVRETNVEVEINSVKKDLLTPSKTFLKDHIYYRKKTAVHSPVNRTKNFNPCFDQSLHCENKSVCSPEQSVGTNLQEIVTDEMVNAAIDENPNKNSTACISTVPCLKSISNVSFQPEKYLQNSFMDNLNRSFNDIKVHTTDSLNLATSTTDSGHSVNCHSKGILLSVHKENVPSYQNSSALQTVNVSEATKILKGSKPIGTSATVSSKTVNTHLHLKNEIEVLPLQLHPNAIPKTTFINTSLSSNSLHAPESIHLQSQICSVLNPNVSTFSDKSEETKSNLGIGSEDFSESKAIISMEVDNSHCPAIFNQSQIEIQKDSAQSKTKQNPTLSQSLNSCSVSEISRDSKNHITNITQIVQNDKGVPSKLIKSNEVDNTEAIGIDSAIETIISEFTHNNVESGESSLLSLFAENSDTTASPLSEESSQLKNNEICDKKDESESWVNAESAHTFPGIKYMLPSLKVVTCENSTSDANKSDPIKNLSREHLVVEKELIKSNEVDDTEAVRIGSAIETIITEFTHNNVKSGVSSLLSLYAENSDTTASPLSEESSQLKNNEICDKKDESESWVNAESAHTFPGIKYMLPSPKVVACENSTSDANKSGPLKNLSREHLVVEKELIKSNEVDDTEAVRIGSAIETIITEFTHNNVKSGVSSSLSLYAENSDTTASPLSEESSQLKNNEICDKKDESESWVNAESAHTFPGIKYIFPSPKVVACEDSNSDANKSDPIKNLSREHSIVEKYNLVAVLPNNKNNNFFDDVSKTSLLISTPTVRSFIPRSVHAGTSQTHSSVLSVGKNCEKESTSNFQKLAQHSNMEQNVMFDNSEKNEPVKDADVFSLNNKRSETIVSSAQMSERNKNVIDNTKIDMFSDQSETNVKRDSFQPNIVHLRSVENIKSSIIEKINCNDLEKNIISKSSIKDIFTENQECIENVKCTNKPVTGLNCDQNTPSVDLQNIAVPFTPLSQAATSKIHPQLNQVSPAKSLNTLSQKRKHSDSISRPGSKRQMILDRLRYPEDLPNFSNPSNAANIWPKKLKLDSKKLLESSVYSTGICNLLLADANVANEESSELSIDHSHFTETIESQKSSKVSNSEIGSSMDVCLVNVSDSERSSSGDSESSSSSDSESSSSSDTNSCKSQPKTSNIPNIIKLSNLDKQGNSVKNRCNVPSGTVQCATVETNPSDSDDDIQVIGEFSNIESSATKESYNSTPSLMRNILQKHTSSKSSNSTSNQISLKTPTNTRKKYLQDESVRSSLSSPTRNIRQKNTSSKSSSSTSTQSSANTREKDIPDETVRSSLPSLTRQKHTSSKSSSSTSTQSSAKTPADTREIVIQDESGKSSLSVPTFNKKKQSAPLKDKNSAINQSTSKSIAGYINLPKGKPFSLLNLFIDGPNDEPVKSGSRKPKTGTSSALKSNYLQGEKTSAVQISSNTVMHANKSVPLSGSKASSSHHQEDDDDDIVCLDDDSECMIVNDDIIHID